MNNGELIQALSEYSSNEEVRVKAESGRTMKIIRVKAENGTIVMEGYWVIRTDGTTMHEIRSGEARPKRGGSRRKQEKEDRRNGIKIVSVRPESGIGRSKKMVEHNGGLIPVAEYRKIQKEQLEKKIADET